MNSSISVLNFMPLHCVLFDIFSVFIRLSHFVFVLGKVSSCLFLQCHTAALISNGCLDAPCSKHMGNLLHLQKIKRAFPHHKQWHVALVLPLKLCILLFHSSNWHIPLISYAVNERAAFAVWGGRTGRNSTLLFLYRSLILLYSYYFDATWIYIKKKRLFQRIWIHSLCRKYAVTFSWTEHKHCSFLLQWFVHDWMKPHCLQLHWDIASEGLPNWK